jgi:predicted N-acetyltransferase YhbS
MRNDVFLREATDQDAPLLLQVLQTAFEEYRGRLDPPSGAHSETVEKLRQKLTTSHVVVAEVEGEIAGCVFYEAENGSMHLERLAVLPSYRRRGLGRRLIDYVEAQARALNLPHVRLGVRVVLKDNWAYYERLGYRLIEYKSHAGYSEPTYVILEKEISALTGEG